MLTCRVSEEAARHERRRELRQRWWENEVLVFSNAAATASCRCSSTSCVFASMQVSGSAGARTCTFSKWPSTMLLQFQEMSLTWSPGASEHTEHELKRERADEYGGKERVTKEKKTGRTKRAEEEEESQTFVSFTTLNLASLAPGVAGWDETTNGHTNSKHWR